MGLPRQEYCSKRLCPPIFQTQELNPYLLHLLHCRRFFTHCATWEAPDFNCIGYLSLGSCGWQGTLVHHAAWHQEGVLLLHMYPRKRSKFRVRFLLNAYHFHTIVKFKNPKLNHHKSGMKYISITHSFQSHWYRNKCVLYIFSLPESHTDTYFTALFKKSSSENKILQEHWAHLLPDLGF